MSQEEEFLQESANRLLSEIYNYHILDSDPAKKEVLKTSLFDKLKEYDSEFYKRYNKVPLNDLVPQFQQQQNYRDLPDQTVIQHNLMRNTFVSDAGYLTRYQRLHKTTTTNPVQQPLDLTAQAPLPPRNYEDEFIDTRYNFKDPNLNQKAYLTNPNIKVNPSSFNEREIELDQLDSNKYQQDLFVLMKQPQIVGDEGLPVITNHKQQIEKLGGIVDTVGAMEINLNEHQMPYQQTRQYGNSQYTKPYIASQQNGGQSDSFLREYTQKSGNSASVLEKSKQMRQQMMQKMQQN